MKEVRESREEYEQEVIKLNAHKSLIEDMLNDLRKGVEIVAKYNMTAFSREQIYNEIWENSTSKTAKKYDVPYQKLKAVCEEHNIPLPTQSYWGSLSAGKFVEKTPLPESDVTEILLPVVDRSKPVELKHKTEAKVNKIPLEVKTTTVSTEEQTAMVSEKYGLSPKKIINTYDRETLYNEVWSEPIVKVAKKYGVSDVAIHKVCRALDIPKPPAGYWRQLETSKKVEQIPLPPTKGPTKKTGFRTSGAISEELNEKPILEFMTEEERENVIRTAQNMLNNLDDNEKLHSFLKENKADIKRWEKDHPRDITATRKRDKYASIPDGEPPLYFDVSEECLPRVHSILNIIFKAVERLGGEVHRNLSLQIRGETVYYNVCESETKVPHVKTIKELSALEKYEKEKLRGRWAYEPQIRKYDYMFNGRVRFCVFEGKYFSDSATTLVENQLGNILIDLYEKSEIIRMEREKREEEKRQREKEQRRREELRELKNKEIQNTIELCNEAEDFITACNIRAYVNAVASKPNLTKEELEWVDWARKKADWFDPTVGREDEFLGKREHSKSSDEKALKPSYRWWY